MLFMEETSNYLHLSECRMFLNELFCFKVMSASQYLLGVLWMLFKQLTNPMPLLIIHKVLAPALPIAMPVQPLRNPNRPRANHNQDESGKNNKNGIANSCKSGFRDCHNHRGICGITHRATTKPASSKKNKPTPILLSIDQFFMIISSPHHRFHQSWKQVHSPSLARISPDLRSYRFDLRP